MSKRILFVLVAAAVGGSALAKLPAVDDATKAKAAETTAKAAWQGKVDAFQLCKSQDKVAAKFATKGGAKPAAAQPEAAAATTPVVFSAPPACADPGPFAYNPPEQKPLETSGAHSPAGNATSPPSVKQESATMAPAKKP
jgi:hypothetical protein